MAIKVMIDSDSDGLLDYMIRRIKDKEDEAKSTKTLKRKAQLNSYAAGLREAVELLDAAIRCQESGAAVEQRGSDFIIKERRAAAAH